MFSKSFACRAGFRLALWLPEVESHGKATYFVSHCQSDSNASNELEDLVNKRKEGVIYLGIFTVFLSFSLNVHLKLPRPPLPRLVNSPLKNEKSRQILPKSRNLAQPTYGS